jgi:hypothetical protein
MVFTDIPFINQPTIVVADVPPLQTVEQNPKFKVFAVGINVPERKNIIDSALVRGLEDGSQAIDFDQWLISFNDFIKALKFTVKTLDDGQLELRTV